MKAVERIHVIVLRVTLGIAMLACSGSHEKVQVQYVA